MKTVERKRLGLVLALAAMMALAGAVRAHEGHGDHDEAAEGKSGKAAKAVTITGEVIDVACYASDGAKGKGADHKECAASCVKGGMPVGFLTDKGEVILAVTGDHTSANALLLPLLATRVKATGHLHARGGVKVLAVDTVEPVAAAKADAGKAAAPATAVAAKEVWVCPMGCEGSKSDHAGKCPVCGMDLVKQKG